MDEEGLEVVVDVLAILAEVVGSIVADARVVVGELAPPDVLDDPISVSTTSSSATAD
jgi:hypothetical protein